MDSQSIYSTHAASYDLGLTLSGYRRGLRKFFARLDLRLPTQPSILDVGCGTGLVSEILIKLYPEAHIIAVDINEEMVEQFRRRVAGWPPQAQRQINISVSDLLAFTTDKKFDLVVAGGVLEYVHLTKAIGHLRGLLKPDGVLLNIAVKKNWLTEKILGRLFRFRPYSLKENARVLVEEGLKNIKTKSFRWSEFPVNLLKIAILGSL